MPLSRARVVLQGVTPHAHESAAIEFIVDALPDTEPYRLWGLTELIDPDGRIYELDALVLGYGALYLVEIKSWEGTIGGNSLDWTVTGPGGRKSTRKSPVRLTAQKARVLGSLLDRHMGKSRPWVEPLVFLSHPDVKKELRGAAQNHVVTRRDFADAITRGEFFGASPQIQRGRIDQRTVQALKQALEKMGLSASKGTMRVGDVILEELVHDAQTHQDWLGTNEHVDALRARVRMYAVPASLPAERRDQRRRAAEREAALLTTIGDHQYVLGLRNFYSEGPNGGPCLVFHDLEDAVTLDRYLEEHPDLPFEDRIEIIRRIAEALDFCHRKQVFHRGLHPGSVLVKGEPGTGELEVRLFNFQLGVQEDGTQGTKHISAFSEQSDLVYLAPEVLQDPAEASPACDLFSLGALAFHILTGRAPATALEERHHQLTATGYLSIAAASDALAGEAPADDDARKTLDLAVGSATFVSPADRPTIREWLDDLLEAVTRPEPVPEPQLDPLDARPNDDLGSGYRVKKILGTGASSRVLLVDRDGRGYALKVPIEQRHEERLDHEDEILKRLSSERIVRSEGMVPLGGRRCLVTTYAGETLADLLAKDGPQTLDYARRWGEDLLTALQVLEEHGVIHRDVKPANLGVFEAGAKRTRHLQLFDFSLATTPDDAVMAGTPAYRDPWLPDRGRWDPAADRFSAAVTLHEIVTGIRPRKEGKANTLRYVAEVERFDPSVRDRLAAFFARALSPKAAERFESAEAMRTEWMSCFATGVAVAPGAEPEAALSDADLDRIGPDTPVEALPLSARAKNALDRAGIGTASELPRLPENTLSAIPGVGRGTAREILAFRKRWLARHPDAARAPEERFHPGFTGEDAPVDQVDGLPPPAARALADAGLDRLSTVALAERARVERLLSAHEDAATVLLKELDARAKAYEAQAHPKALQDWVDALLPRRGGARTAWPRQMRWLMGVEPYEGRRITEPPALAEALGITRQAVYIALGKAREQWRAHDHMGELHAQTLSALESLGGVAPLSRAAAALAARIPHAPGTADSPEAGFIAEAVARMSAETTEAFSLGRLRDGAERWLSVSRAHLAAARKLGEVADDLARREPLPSSAEVREALNAAVAAGPLDGLPDERLVALAAEASENAAVSARLEVYPRGLDPVRAVRLSAGVLGGRRPTPDEVRRAIRARYPDAAPLPDRPELDRLVAEAGLSWDESAGRYAREAGPEGTASHTVAPRPQPTTHTSHRPAATPEIVEAEAFERDVKLTLENKEVRVLEVYADYAHGAAGFLADRLGLTRVSLDRALITAAKAVAAEKGVKPEKIYEADQAGPADKGWKNLLKIMSLSAERVEEDLVGTGEPILLTEPGLLARYELDPLVERLVASVREGKRPAALLFLVPKDSTLDGGVVHGAHKNLTIPGLPTQRLHVPLSWIENRHRGGAA